MGRVRRRFHHTNVVVQLVCGMVMRCVFDVAFMMGVVGGRQEEGDQWG